MWHVIFNFIFLCNRVTGANYSFAFLPLACLFILIIETLASIFMYLPQIFLHLPIPATHHSC
jgi:hypothetical protein